MPKFGKRLSLMSLLTEADSLVAREFPQPDPGQSFRTSPEFLVLLLIVQLCLRREQSELTQTLFLYEVLEYSRYSVLTVHYPIQ